jgi:hypothetical protein
VEGEAAIYHTQSVHGASVRSARSLGNAAGAASLRGQTPALHSALDGANAPTLRRHPPPAKVQSERRFMRSPPTGLACAKWALTFVKSERQARICDSWRVKRDKVLRAETCISHIGRASYGIAI